MIFYFLLGTYMVMIFIDYIAARFDPAVDRKWCDHYWVMVSPNWSYNLIFPGWGEACLDKGYYPNASDKRVSN